MPQNSLTDREKPTAIDEAREDELMARFGEALSPLIYRFGYEGIDSIGLLMARLRQADPQVALVLMENSPALIEGLLPYGEELVLNVFGLAGRLIPFGPYLSLKFLEMSPRFLEKSDYEILIKTTVLIGEIAAVHEDLAVSLMGHSPELIESAGFAGLEKLAIFSAAIAGSSRTYALKTVESCLPIINSSERRAGFL
jgi:hypothetical protein